MVGYKGWQPGPLFRMFWLCGWKTISAPERAHRPCCLMSSARRSRLEQSRRGFEAQRSWASVIEAEIDIGDVFLDFVDVGDVGHHQRVVVGGGRGVAA